MIQIITYRPDWPQEFAEIGGRIRESLSELALRIDHIGSTAVPGLAAKDIIDIQLTVHELSGAVQSTLEGAGYARREGIWTDHVPPGQPASADEWSKWLFKPAGDQRPANVHVRVAGRLNQRYPLLFRDYLRAHSPVAQAYAQVKLALARYHPDDMDAYYDVKDPVCDIIMGAAEDWAAAARWQPGPSDC